MIEFEPASESTKKEIPLHELGGLAAHELRMYEGPAVTSPYPELNIRVDNLEPMAARSVAHEVTYQGSPTGAEIFYYRNLHGRE